MINKKKNKKVIKQGFIQGIVALIFSQVLIKLLGLIYKLYLTNKSGFGDTGNAIYSSGFQIYALLLTLSSIGVPNAVAKMISEKVSIGDHKGAHRIFKVSFLTFASIGFLCSLLLFISAHYIANVWLQIPEAELTLISLSPSIFFVAIISVIRGYFNGRQTMKATANSQTLEQFLKTIFTVGLVEIASYFSSCNTVLMAAAANLATTFATMGSFFYLYKYYKFRRREIGNEIYNSVKYKRKSWISIINNILYVTIPMSLTSILTSINKNVDSITVVRGLKSFLGEAEAKLQYGILSGKVDTLISLPLSFNLAFATALVPALSSAIANKNKEAGIKKISFSLLITILIGLPSSIVMAVFAKPILNLLFPNANSGELILQIAAISIIFTVLGQTVNGALQGIGKIFVPAISLSIGVAIKIILNIILVPLSPEECYFGGVAGAALATVVCHMVAFFISFYILKRKTHIKIDFNKFVIKPIIASTMMAICSYYSYEMLKGIIIEDMATILSIIFAIIIYIISIIILKVFKKEEILMIPHGEKIYNILEKTGMYHSRKYWKIGILEETKTITLTAIMVSKKNKEKKEGFYITLANIDSSRWKENVYIYENL